MCVVLGIKIDGQWRSPPFHHNSSRQGLGGGVGESCMLKLKATPSEWAGIRRRRTHMRAYNNAGAVQQRSFSVTLPARAEDVKSYCKSISMCFSHNFAL